MQVTKTIKASDRSTDRIGEISSNQEINQSTGLTRSPQIKKSTNHPCSRDLKKLFNRQEIQEVTSCCQPVSKMLKGDITCWTCAASRQLSPRSPPMQKLKSRRQGRERTEAKNQHRVVEISANTEIHQLGISLGVPPPLADLLRRPPLLAREHAKIPSPFSDVQLPLGVSLWN